MERRDLTGTTIAGRYRVLRRLGVGGMGSVFLVQHTESLQHYALKTLHDEVASDRLAVERFLREARAAAALRSKNVVKVVDAQMTHLEESTGHPLPFIVMELLEGANLEQIVQRQGRLSPAETVWVLRGVARALDVAHQKGIVHRDLKPENVFLAHDDDGEPVTKVCDFGIAKLAGDAAAGLMASSALGTQTGTTVGTPMYMAPEQARSSTDVVVATDQWAVGLIAFKALTGREYFSTARSTAELLLQIVNDPLDAPTQRLSTLPHAFDAWFFRSCMRNPAERWPSAGEQVAALAEALEVADAAPPLIPKSETGLATAETVNVASLSPQAPSLVQTTAAPASRTVGGDVTTAAPAASRNRRGPLVVVGALALVSLIGGVVLVRGRGEQPVVAPAASSPAAPTASPTPTPTPAPTPVPTPVPTPTAIPSVSATVAIKPFSTAKVKATATATTTASAATTAPPVGKSKLPKGAACSRSSECASGFCVAEECQ